VAVAPDQQRFAVIYNSSPWRWHLTTRLELLQSTTGCIAAEGSAGSSCAGPVLAALPLRGLHWRRNHS